MKTNVRKSVLNNGVRLVTETVPGAASVAFGLWVDAGSRDEGPSENGLAHLIEHLVFKGTAARDKRAIAKEIDRQGGLANAYTTKEQTCFHTRVRPEHLAGAVDLLVDIFQNSLYDETELELEKQIIQQEIAMVEDEPEELALELAEAAFWPGHPLGRPVAGTMDSVAALNRSAVLSWLERHYTGPRLVVSAAGAVEHQPLADLLAARLRVRSERAPRALSLPPTCAGLQVKSRPLEQVHLVAAGVFPDALDERRHAAAILNLALGGNMSSRLFQTIREDRGLAYSVYSCYTPYQGAGCLEVYAAVAPDKIAETRDLIMAELGRLAETPLTPTELAEAVSGLKTSFILGGESLDSRMARLGRNELVFGRLIAMEEICRELEAVTAEAVLHLAAEFLCEDRFLTLVLGPIQSPNCTASGV